MIQHLHAFLLLVLFLYGTLCSLQLGFCSSLCPLEVNIHNEIAVRLQVPFSTLRELLLASRKAEEKVILGQPPILTHIRGHSICRVSGKFISPVNWDPGFLIINWTPRLASTLWIPKPCSSIASCWLHINLPFSFLASTECSLTNQNLTVIVRGLWHSCSKREGNWKRVSVNHVGG